MKLTFNSEYERNNYLIKECFERDISARECEKLTGIDRRTISKVGQQNNFTYDAKKQKWLKQLHESDLLKKENLAKTINKKQEIETVKNHKDDNSEYLATKEETEKQLTKQNSKIASLEKRISTTELLIAELATKTDDSKKRPKEEELLNFMETLIDQKLETALDKYNTINTTKLKETYEKDKHKETSNIQSIKTRYINIMELYDTDDSVVTSIRVPANLLTKFSDFCEDKKIKKGQLITVLIEEYMNNNNQ